MIGFINFLCCVSKRPRKKDSAILKKERKEKYCVNNERQKLGIITEKRRVK